MVGRSARYTLSSAKDYWILLKPRIMYLVVFTSTTGMIVAPGSIHPLIGLVAAICVALGAGASGALNMWYDSDIDALMSRTKLRPIPAGKIMRVNALECGLALSILSVLLMAIAVNYLSAILLAGSIFFYVVIYTIILKRRTPQNIVIGGIAGALPPVIGWASVTGSIAVESLLLFLIIFLWTPPHFWALSLLNRDDYRLAGVPMLSVCDLESTKKHMLFYSIALFVASLLPGLYMHEKALYWIIAASLGIAFITRSLTVYRELGEPSHEPCMGMFSFSIYYLFLIFSAITLCY
ncbi:heme o synthase [Candidatus Anaplasma sp. TIGMIC]|uniref:heme o synthase n=1 Tax=Candidatus Anaplasma sp. TIGMIC TaxID=3020713 RepID=UPI00232F6122|nr:heme o synthase [Candidatus Anaplasma sp. TIGMIC]MDB1135523.1 heme o synthase [Candidatus Anaplasma sp. TIGMIC]